MKIILQYVTCRENAGAAAALLKPRHLPDLVPRVHPQTHRGPMDEAIVRFQQVDFAYENGVPVLEGINFAIWPRELVAMVGPNGGGKTTLLKLMTGMLHPSSGSVSLFGKNPASVRSRIGYMPQYLHFDPDFPITVEEVVLMGRLGRRGIRGFFGWPEKRDRMRAMDCLAHVEMEKLASRPFSALSGGQRQRVMIARALACDPELLLLDEPTANVDSQTESRFMALLQELSREITILMVSHDMGFVSAIVKSVLCVNRRVVVHPTTELTGMVIQDIYNCSMQMVRHDHRCTEKGHTHVIPDHDSP
ncbi:ABC transporter ATP-binding protein [Desulfobotulus sp.]|uniref:metal ABC transporter ATP-binding protein n=1 Tax=Desulfobotulus sp. TaxID=1940337 RepID=UPI002A363045|nr:ABC transporter ATP-binding protein [Desulfobotulus sp.]MDY0162579.1 ABC transporter ATP-binding protein [Desulfobotulus sp.]